MGELNVNCVKILPPKEGLYQGVFVGDTISEHKIEAFEQMSGTQVDIALKFLAFSTGLAFPAAEAKIVSDKGGAILIKLEPWSAGGKKDRSYTLEDLIGGKYDHLLKRFAKGAKEFGKPVFVSFGHEMNGNWYPWSGNPELYKKAFQHVHAVIENAGARNITWVWNPDIFADARAYYPGDKYVDWIGIDGYNTEDYGSPWKSCAQLFSTRIAELDTLGKPMMIGEFGSDANTPTDETTLKPEFLASCISHFAEGKRVKGFVYFNLDKVEDGKDKMWAIRTAEAKRAYREAIQKYEQSFRGQIRTVTCAGKENAPATQPLFTTAEKPEKISSRTLPYGQLDPKLHETDRFVLKRSEVEENLDLPQLEETLLALLEVPPQRTLNHEDYRFAKEQFDRLYPEFSKIRTLDEKNDFKLFTYLRNFRSYWDNAVLLLSVYTQKIIESTLPDKDDKIALALKMAENFKQRIMLQLYEDDRGHNKRGSSDYNFDLLTLTTAELYSQTKNRDEAFYREGIYLANLSLQGFLSVENKDLYPSRPDHFSITKGLLILGDLYQHLGHLADDEGLKRKYLEQADYLYRRVTAMNAGDGINLGTGLSVSLTIQTIAKAELRKLNLSPEAFSMLLDFLFESPNPEQLTLLAKKEELPLLLGKMVKGSKISAAQAASLEALLQRAYLTIEVSSEELRQALNFNLEMGHLSEEDKELAQMGTYHYLRGAAMIKQAGLFSGWPRLKYPQEIVAQLLELKTGMEQIVISKQSLLQKKREKLEAASLTDARVNVQKELQKYADKLEQRNAFILHLSRLIHGELLMMLSDRINYYTLRDEDSAEQKASKKEVWDKTLVFVAAQLERFKDEPYYEQLRSLGQPDFEDRKVLANSLVDLVYEEYLRDIPKEFKYLSAWSRVKMLEIMVRNAIYVIKTKKGRVADPAEILAFCEKIAPLLEEISSDSTKAEYLKVEFDYLQAVLRLSGLPHKDKDGKYIIIHDSTGGLDIKTTYYADEILSLVETIEKDIQTLPPASRLYFEIYANLKEVGVVIQSRERKRTQNERILKRAAEILKIKEDELVKMNQQTVLLRYALYLLKQIELKVAPPLPPYLEYNLNKTLRERIKKGQFNQVGKEINPFKTFINQVVSNHYPEVAKIILGDKGEKGKPGTPGLLTILENHLRHRDTQKSLEALDQILEVLKAVDPSINFAREYAELLSWDLHSLRAELYHQTAMIYSILEKGTIMYQYAQSAFLESVLSSSPYDYKQRPFFIKAVGTSPDEKIPQLKELAKLLPKIKHQKVKF